MPRAYSKKGTEVKFAIAYTATGTPAVDQVQRQVADPTPERADGGVREVGPMSTRDV